MQDRLFTAYQVADLLGATPGVVAGWIQDGRLVSQRLPGGARRISERQLVQFLQREGIDFEQILADVTSREDKDAGQESSVEPGAVAVAARPQAPPAIAAAPDEEPPQLPQVELPAAEIEPEPVPVEAAPPAETRPARRKAGSKPRRRPTPARTPAQLARSIVQDALLAGATAIHIEDDGKAVTLRLRLHGELHEKDSFKKQAPKALGAELIDYFLSLGGLEGDTTAPRMGQFEMGTSHKPALIGLSAVSTPRGRKIVLRFITAARPKLSQLNLPRKDAQTLSDLLARPWGMMILSAPPRNSAERTLAAMAGHLAGAGRSVFYLARGGAAPVDGVTYCTCASATGMSWSDGLRAGAAQDADVVVIEDVVDPATARAAVEAASAGALIIGAVRSSSLAAALAMLERMGVEPWALASVLTAVLAQRTVRTLCGECRKRVRPTNAALAKLGLTRRQIDYPVYAARGCDRCNSSGYLGQAVLLTVTGVDESLADAVRGAAAERALPASGLLEPGLERLKEGTTTLDELIRAQLV